MLNKKQKTKNILKWTKLIVPAFMLVLFLPVTHAFANDIIGQEEKIIELTNEVRQHRGVSPLIQDSRLMASALQKAQDMAEQGYFSHANLNNQRMSYWINNVGYKYSLAGENLAKGFSSADRLVHAWEKSFSHYVNLVEPKFEHIGIGIAKGNFKGKEMVFVVQHFGIEQNSQNRASGYYIEDFTSPIMKFIPRKTTVAINTLGDSEVITETSIIKPESISTGGQGTEETNGLIVLITIVALAGIGCIVNYTNANHLSRKILLEKSLRTRGSPRN